MLLGQQGPGLMQRAAKGGAHSNGNGVIHRHTERGTDTSGGGWRVAGAGDTQVGGASRQDRRSGVGSIERELIG